MNEPHICMCMEYMDKRYVDEAAWWTGADVLLCRCVTICSP